MVEFKTFSSVELIQHMGSDELAARAARVSTGKDQLDQGKIEGLIRYCAESGHSSVFEHNVATFRIETPLFVRDQIVRHRTFSYNILSLRYTEAEPAFYLPDLNRPVVNSGTSARPELTEGTREQVKATQEAHVAACIAAWDNYQDMIEAGVANEVARSVLPTSTFTAMYMTGNLWNWAKFLRLRNGSDGHPQQEVTEVAQQIEYQLRELYPLSMKGLLPND